MSREQESDASLELDHVVEPAGDAPTRTPSRSRVLPPGGLRLTAPPSRRGPAILLALVVGALIAAVPGGLGSPEVVPAQAASAAEYGLGATDAAMAGGLGDMSAQQEITAVEAQARLDQLAASRAAREPRFASPTEGLMTTCFCMRWGMMHWGVDLAAPLGTPIHAVSDGVVVRAGPASGYGNAVYVQDPDGNVQVYGHMRYYSVDAGDVVSAGDQIAEIGNEGQSTGPHLHFEIHEGGFSGAPIDP